MKTSSKQKILLGCFSVLLTLVLLEVGLRLSGIIYLAVQHRHDQVSFQENEVRILCLGESTTALGFENSYPAQLREILGSIFPNKKIVVINKGLTDKTSQDIFLSLEHNLRLYRPHIVITMIGINDVALFADYETFRGKIHRRMKNMRVYNLGVLLGQHLKAKADELFDRYVRNIYNPEYIQDKFKLYDHEKIRTSYAQMLTALEDKKVALKQKIERAQGKQLEKHQAQYIKLVEYQVRILLRLADYYNTRGQKNNSENVLLKAIALNKRYSHPYHQLGLLYREQKKYDLAVQSFREAIQRDPKYFLSHMQLGYILDEMGQKEDAFKNFQYVYRQPYEGLLQRLYPEIAQWFIKSGYPQEAEQVYLKAMRFKDCDYILFHDAAVFYENKGDLLKAKVLYQEAKDRRGQRSLNSSFTRFYYNQIVREVLQKRARIIALQYPLRDIDDLKGLIDHDLHNQVLFLENKDNFGQIIEKEGLAYVFEDFFAGDFGHATPAGNRLIALNLAKEIVKNRLVELDPL